MKHKLKFEIYTDEAGEFRWRLIAHNKKIIAVSGEGYKRQRACLKAVYLVKEGAMMAEIVEVEEKPDDE